MSSFSIIHPKDDADAIQASDWLDDLVNDFKGNGHSLADDVLDATPADAVNILAALGSGIRLVCYFGHGDEDSFLTNGSPTVDVKTIKVSKGAAVVAIACKTANNLGPAAITAGADAWLGFTISVPVVARHKTRDPIGEAIVRGLSGLRNGDTMQQVRDALWNELDDLVRDYDAKGKYHTHPYRWQIYYGSMAIRDHLALHGNSSCVPL